MLASIPPVLKPQAQMLPPLHRSAKLHLLALCVISYKLHVLGMLCGCSSTLWWSCVHPETNRSHATTKAWEQSHEAFRFHHTKWQC